MDYAISSDQHCHNWTQFASVAEDGTNSRLRIILDELLRKAEECRETGVKRMFLGGDLFHVRGRLEPSCFNPTFDTFKIITGDFGIEVIADAGNHDLEGKHSTKLGNAMEKLGEIKGFIPVTKASVFDDMIVIPWIEDLVKLRLLLNKLSETKGASKRQLLIHAPVNGVIRGIPDHGLEAGELKALGFKRVWAGHYHNARDFDDGVLSIGATTHQTWSDPGTKAGFWLADDEGEAHFETAAPLFINYKEGDDFEAFKGNYARIQLVDTTREEVKRVREALLDCGARGVVDHSSIKRTSARAAASTSTGATLEASIGGFIDRLETSHDKKRITEMSMEVLREARMRLTSE